MGGRGDEGGAGLLARGGAVLKQDFAGLGGGFSGLLAMGRVAKGGVARKFPRTRLAASGRPNVKAFLTSFSQTEESPHH